MLDTQWGQNTLLHASKRPLLYFVVLYLWICRLRRLSATLSCWDGRALQRMVMMGLAKMKQTIQMEMIYFTWVDVPSVRRVGV